MTSKLPNLCTLSFTRSAVVSRFYTTGLPGSGVGKGGGGGGTIREAGGAFGEMEAARENEYFRKLSSAQLQELKKGLEKRIAHHEEQILHHTDNLKKMKENARRLKEAAAKKNEES